jgi:hypothetical protein
MILMRKSFAFAEEDVSVKRNVLRKIDKKEKRREESGGKDIEGLVGPHNTV